MSTIRDVANLAKVSTATVSRVLNNDTKYKMTNETRDRVLQAASQLNYKASSPIEKSSQSKSDMKIGCILSVTPKKYNDPYFMSILSEVESQLTSRGYGLSILRTGPELEDKNNLYSTFKEPITGLIIMEALQDELYDYIKKQVPYVVGVDTPWDDIDCVGYDHFNAANNAVIHLIDKGHKKIGFIGGSGLSKDITKSQRYKGYLTTMLTAGLSVNQDWVIDCAWNEETCMTRVNELCKTKNYPTAFFVASDLMAMATMSSLYNNGIRIPDDIAVIGISNIEISKYSTPPLTTIEIPTKEIGIIATDLLISRINGDNLLPRKVTFPTNLVLRSST